jgi:phage-related protein
MELIVSSINTISSSGALGQVSSPKKTPSAFEINSKEFGSTAATAIDAAATAVDAASSTVSFSTEGLKRLSSMAGSAVDAVEGAMSDLGSEISSLARDATDEVKKAYHAVESSISSVVTGVESAVTSVEDTVSSAVTAVEDGISSVVNKTAGYAALGVSALS